MQQKNKCIGEFLYIHRLWSLLSHPHCATGIVSEAVVVYKCLVEVLTFISEVGAGEFAVQ